MARKAEMEWERVATSCEEWLKEMMSSTLGSIDLQECLPPSSKRFCEQKRTRLHVGHV